MAAGLLDEASSRAGRMASVLVHDALVAVPAYRAHILLYLGHYEQAKAQNALSLAQAERLARPHRRAVTLALSSLFYTMLKEDAPQLLDTLEDLAADQGFQYWAGYALMLRGVTLAWAGKVREGMTLLRRGAAPHDAAGAAWAPKFLAMVAEPVGGGEGLALVGEAFARYAGTEARLLVPELHRIRGVLLAGEGDAVGAEADFVKALDLAREQEARHWELRAATGLARLWRDQGRWVEARDLLTPVYGWFTEGFGLPDLREAKALLDQLA
jgi:predicted ATPase